MSKRPAPEVEVSSEEVAVESERTGSFPTSAVLRRADAPADGALHAVVDGRRSDIVERFVRALREEHLTRPDAPRAAVIDDLSFFLADIADALRGSLPAAPNLARRHGNRRHLLGFDLGAVLREYSVLRCCILAVAHDAGIIVAPEQLAILNRTIDDAMADAALAYAEQRDAELRVEREALEAERTRLARAVASRDDVMAIVSHDLRNPLTSIGLGVDQLRRHSGDAPRRDRILESIDRSVHRMTALIEDLLAIAKIDAGQLSLQLVTCPADALVDDALAIVRPLAESKSIELETSIESDLVVRCDRDRLLQVLGNLLGNAMKFTPEGGRVAIEVAAVSGSARFSVRDTGSGIPAESLPYVFDRFYQGPGRRRGGAGLGLAIARAIVEGHRGKIGVECAPTGGTTFQFTVPLANPSRPSTF